MKKQILVVDDHAVNRELIRCVLEVRGFEVIEAVDGADALERLSSATPDLILMDLQMPRLDGFQAVDRIRANTTHARLPVVAVSALAMAEDRERSLQAGFNAFVSKPIDFKELDAVLKRFLNGSSR